MSRVIIITGANNGIGLAMARALLDKGDQVAALDLSTETLDHRFLEIRPSQCEISR
jgi:NAD(P)-dependent dehydrogenase (short-subunit alcohol dehydrogenase family)